jgi:hypothetical protein
MNWRLVPLYVLALALGMALLWWLVFPDNLSLALKDSLLAGAVASVVAGIFSNTRF